ncbi:M48 family metalloprotease [Haloarchaeobius sp. TZWWS8]|uniref:M48 family metalloprotease n=1 Tax=Haloarchaeobius sp. TZWWS8 TaxID=3446121 RepID=UPI003EB8C569
MDWKLRLSLGGRMAVAVAVVAALSVVVALFTGVVSAYLLGGILAWLGTKGVAALLAAPRLSSSVSTSPVLVAIPAGATCWLVLTSWQRVAGYTSDDYLVPPSDATQWLLVLVLLGSLYLAVFETAAAIVFAVSSVADDLHLFLGIYLLGFLVGIWAFVHGVRKTVRSLQQRSVADAVPADEADQDLTGLVARLAQHANVPAPTVQVTPRDRPEAFTVGSGDDALLVVSEGLLALLPADELEAVLAHEVSHLANGDSRVMALALAPIVYAEDLYVDEPDDLGDRVWNALFTLLLRVGQLGVSLLSVGREWAADAGAAELTGSPSSLASALLRLDEQHGIPRRDAREWSEAYAVLDVVPTLDPDGGRFPFRTHPSTADRVERLRRLAKEKESV